MPCLGLGEIGRALLYYVGPFGVVPADTAVAGELEELDGNEEGTVGDALDSCWETADKFTGLVDEDDGKRLRVLDVGRTSVVSEESLSRGRDGRASGPMRCGDLECGPSRHEVQGLVFGEG